MRLQPRKPGKRIRNKEIRVEKRDGARDLRCYGRHRSRKLEREIKYERVTRLVLRTRA